MKNINLYFILFLLATPLYSMDDPIMLTTIFAPAPLLELHHKSICKSGYVSFLKKATIPLTGCFYFGIKKNDIWTDAIKYPYAAAIITYAMVHYCTYLVLQNEQNKIDEEILDMMQHIFHLLIIGHGIYNKITTANAYEHKISTLLNASALSTLQMFLHKAYNTWFILFSYYEEHYQDKPLYAYRMDQIDLFEVLQASTYEPDISPLITNFYAKNNKNYDYEPILNCLEIKLKLINHKLLRVLPTQDHHDDEN